MEHDHDNGKSEPEGACKEKKTWCRPKALKLDHPMKVMVSYKYTLSELNGLLFDVKFTGGEQVHQVAKAPTCVQSD